MDLKAVCFSRRPPITGKCLCFVGFLVILMHNQVESTIVPASVTTTTWTTSGNPYELNENVEVPSGETLTIEPGVTLIMGPQKSMTVNGKISAIGTAAQPIIIQPSTSSHWGAIIFTQFSVPSTFDSSGEFNGGSSLQFVNMTKGGAGTGVMGIIWLTSSSIYVANCAVSQSVTHGLYSTQGDRISIVRSDISYNGQSGVYCEHSASVFVSHSTVSHNCIYGVYSSHSPKWEYCHNRVEDNGNYGLCADIGMYNGILANNTLRNCGISGYSGSKLIVQSNNVTGSMPTSAAIMLTNDLADGTVVEAVNNHIEECSGTSGLVYQSGASRNFKTTLVLRGNKLIRNSFGNSAMMLKRPYFDSYSPYSHTGSVMECNVIENNVYSGSSTTIGAISIIYDKSATLLVRNNVFANPSYPYELQNTNDVTMSPLNVSGNWFGSMDAAYVSSRIYDYSKQSSLSLVHVAPLKHYTSIEEICAIVIEVIPTVAPPSSTPTTMPSASPITSPTLGPAVSPTTSPTISSTATASATISQKTIPIYSERTNPTTISVVTTSLTTVVKVAKRPSPTATVGKYHGNGVAYATESVILETDGQAYITSLNPTFGVCTGQYWMIIAGAGFMSDASYAVVFTCRNDTGIRIIQTGSDVVYLSSTEIRGRVPNVFPLLSFGDYPVECTVNVESDTGKSNSLAFTYYAGANRQLSDSVPASAPCLTNGLMMELLGTFLGLEGTSVTCRFSTFQDVFHTSGTVVIGGVKIHCPVPFFPAPSLDNTLQNCSVSVPVGDGTWANALQITLYPPITVVDFDPKVSPIDGGSLMSIQVGGGLCEIPDGTMGCRFGLDCNTSTCIATATYNSATSLSCVIPPHAEGDVYFQISPNSVFWSSVSTSPLVYYHSPSSTPTATPSASPTTSPTLSPTASPTTSPTISPTTTCSTSPSISPTTSPTSFATTSPTTSATTASTVSPTTSPTATSSVTPTTTPTTSPTVSPTTSPTTNPTTSPTTTPSPTAAPFTSTPTPSWIGPTPTPSPTTSPSASPSPTSPPTTSPITTTATASPSPMTTPSLIVSSSLIPSPTASPTASPTTSLPTSPTTSPSCSASASPATSPSSASSPTTVATTSPTTSPSVTTISSTTPTTSSTPSPIISTSSPTATLSTSPTSHPTTSPTATTAASLTTSPTATATATPTSSPTTEPTSSPTPPTPTPLTCPSVPNIPTGLSGTWIMTKFDCIPARFDNKYRVTQNGEFVQIKPLQHPDQYPSMALCLTGNSDFAVINGTATGSCHRVEGNFNKVSHNMRLTCTVNGVQCDTKFNCIDGDCSTILASSSGRASFVWFFMCLCALCQVFV